LNTGCCLSVGIPPHILLYRLLCVGHSSPSWKLKRLWVWSRRFPKPVLPFGSQSMIYVTDCCVIVGIKMPRLRASENGAASGCRMSVLMPSNIPARNYYYHIIPASTCHLSENLQQNTYGSPLTQKTECSSSRTSGVKTQKPQQIGVTKALDSRCQPEESLIILWIKFFVLLHRSRFRCPAPNCC